MPIHKTPVRKTPVYVHELSLLGIALLAGVGISAFGSTPERSIESNTSSTVFLSAPEYTPQYTEISSYSQEDVRIPSNSADEVTENISDPATLLPVVRIIDGDTIVVRENKTSTVVRLIGIDTPEKVHPTKETECFAEEASEYMRLLLEGRSVYLENDPSQDQFDKYGRLLAYVYRGDGLFINREMITRGYAYEYTFIVPYAFQSIFQVEEEEARQERRGMWASGVCDTPSYTPELR